jgi:hypothetical protein
VASTIPTVSPSFALTARPPTLTASVVGWSLFAACIGAHAYELPNSVDLHATYCVAVLQYQLSLFNSMPPDTPPEMQRAIATEKDQASYNLSRLQLYLMPRVPGLDPVSLAFALESGDEDAPRAVQAKAHCVAGCANNADQGACLRKCIQESEVMKRTATCSDTSWLPL